MPEYNISLTLCLARYSGLVTSRHWTPPAAGENNSSVITTRKIKARQQPPGHVQGLPLPFQHPACCWPGPPLSCTRLTRLLPAHFLTSLRLAGSTFLFYPNFPASWLLRLEGGPSSKIPPWCEPGLSLHNPHLVDPLAAQTQVLESDWLWVLDPPLRADTTLGDR